MSTLPEKISTRSLVHDRFRTAARSDSIVLVHSNARIAPRTDAQEERDGIGMSYGLVYRGLRDGLLGKVRNWGHSVDRDWVADINNAFDEVERTDVALRRVVHVYQRHCSCSSSSVHKRRRTIRPSRQFASLLRDVSRDARVASFVIAYDDTTGSLASHLFLTS
eukprot:gene24992-10653_t